MSVSGSRVRPAPPSCMSYAAPSCMHPCHMPPYDMDLRSMTHRSEGHSMHGAMTWVCPPVRVGGPHGCTYPIASQYVGSAHKTAEQVMRAKWVWGLHRTRQRHSKEYGRRGRRADQGRGRCRVVAIHQYAPVCGVCGVCVVNIEWYRCVNTSCPPPTPPPSSYHPLAALPRPQHTTAHRKHQEKHSALHFLPAPPTLTLLVFSLHIRKDSR